MSTPLQTIAGTLRRAASAITADAITTDTPYTRGFAAGVLATLDTLEHAGLPRTPDQDTPPAAPLPFLAPIGWDALGTPDRPAAGTFLATWGTTAAVQRTEPTDDHPRGRWCTAVFHAVDGGRLERHGWALHRVIGLTPETDQ